MVLARRLVAGVLLAAAGATTGVAAGATPVAAAPSGSGTSASALYKDVLATTRSWSVHYASNSTQSKQTLVERGDAGPASGSQTVLMGKGSISILVIGGISYVKGNVSGLQSLAGLSASQAAETTGQWIEFSTDNSAFAPVVAGVRSQDVAKELALKAPLSRGPGRMLDGDAVDAIDGTQTFGRKTQHVVLYVRAHGSHFPVEEDSVNAKGKSTAAEHITYSRWGRRCGPRPPWRPSPSGPSAPFDRWPTPDRPAGVGRWDLSPTWLSRRSPRHRAGPPGE